MRVFYSVFISITSLVILAAPAHSCGVYGFHQPQPGASPWVGLSIFAAILFGSILAGQNLPKLGQGAIIGLLFAGAIALNVFSFSILFYPMAFIAKILLVAMAIIVVVHQLGYRSKQEVLGLGRYGLGLIFGLLLYLPFSSYVPALNTNPEAGWIANISPSKTPLNRAQSRNEFRRPVFATSTQKIAENARASGHW